MRRRDLPPAGIPRRDRRLPTPAETKVFSRIARPTSAASWSITCLSAQNTADHWANKWADLMRPNPYHVGIKAVFTFDAFLRPIRFRQNKRMTSSSRRSSPPRAAPGAWGRRDVSRRRLPDELTTIVSQLFLGVRLNARSVIIHRSRCTARTIFTASPPTSAAWPQRAGDLRPDLRREEVIFNAPTAGAVKHPGTASDVAAAALLLEGGRQRR